VGRLYQRLPRWGKETAEVTRRILVSGPEVELVSWDTRTLPHRYLVRVLDGEAHRFEVVQ
jgi:diphthamide synthase (EF-2-diphthine--ammonia ligase)